MPEWNEWKKFLWLVRSILKWIKLMFLLNFRKLCFLFVCLRWIGIGESLYQILLFIILYDLVLINDMLNNSPVIFFTFYKLYRFNCLYWLLSHSLCVMVYFNICHKNFVHNFCLLFYFRCPRSHERYHQLFCDFFLLFYTIHRSICRYEVFYD